MKLTTFKEWFESQLNEMPYFYLNTANKEEHQFDPEIEKRTLQELEQVFLDMLTGKPLTDKYENTIQLNTPEEKQQLINVLQDPKDRFMMMILGKYGSQISPNVQDIKKPNDKRTPEEVVGYLAWVDNLIKRSNIKL